jgi:hypothetical protein
MMDSDDREVKTPDELWFEPARAIRKPGLAIAFARLVMGLPPGGGYCVPLDREYHLIAWKARLVGGTRQGPTRPWVRPGSGIVGGYFRRIDSLVCEIQLFDGVGLYLLPNPVRRDDRSDLTDRIGWVTTGEGVRIDHVMHINWIFIDIDPGGEGAKREGNSTAEEHAACIYMANLILTKEPAIEQAALWGSSGNGAYILIHADMANTPENRGTVKQFVESLKEKYAHKDAHIDKQWNPSKPVGLPGSRKCKYEATPDRPRRIVGCYPLDRAREIFDVGSWLLENGVRPMPVATEPRFLGPAEVGQATGQVTGSSAPRASGRRRSRRRKGDVKEATWWALRQREAVSGQHGHDRTVAMAGTVFFGWDLARGDSLEILKQWNLGNDDRWEDEDLERKLDAAITEGCKHKDGPGYMRGISRRGRKRKGRAPRKSWTLPQSFEE